MYSRSPRGGRLPALAALLPVAFPLVHERRVEVDGRHVNLHVGGRGPDVVLLHGLLGRPDYLLPLARSLARTRRVIVPALPGHAGSDRLRPFTFAAAAELLRLAVARLGAESPALLAHSYSVPVAVWWAASHPVASLVCTVAGSWYSAGSWGWPSRTPSILVWAHA